jgi:nucleotide-binding universal stress UspA family protein
MRKRREAPASSNAGGNMTRSILVATDGKAGSAGALRMARALEARDGSRVEILAVHEPAFIYPVGTPDSIAILPPEFNVGAVEALRDTVRAQATAAGLDDHPVIVEVGGVAPSIARVAAERRSDLILLGLHDGGGLAHWRARETLLRLIHLAHIPVLAVTPEAPAPPRQALVATDFSDFSVRAAREAIHAVGPGVRVHLVHVVTQFTWAPGASDMDEWLRTYREGVVTRLEELADTLRRAGALSVQTHVRVGDPARQILKLAEEIDADLIAVGSHGSGFFGRIILGSVSGRTIHHARCSVLVSPPQSIPTELSLDLTDRELLSGLGRAGDVGLPQPPMTR